MGGILTAAAIMAGLGLFFAVVLTVAWRFLRVEEDPRVAAVEARLPATNCGACGEAGCRAFAEKLVAGEKQPSACTVSGADAIDAIAELLGVDAGESRRLVARLHCAGGTAEAFRVAAYDGYGTCGTAHVAGGGGKACPWGCLGLGDCAVACTPGAIHMNDDGLPVVDPDRCTACGDCVVACPRNLFVLEPLDVDVVVQCAAPLTGEAASAVCAAACDACGRCAQDAPEGRIRMVDGLPRLDLEGGPLGPRPTLRCPTGAIAWLPDGRQLAAERKRRSHA